MGDRKLPHLTVHPRDERVRKAECELIEAIDRTIASNELTLGESLRVVSSAMHSWLGYVAKLVIAGERRVDRPTDEQGEIALCNALAPILGDRCTLPKDHPGRYHYCKKDGEPGSSSWEGDYSDDPDALASAERGQKSPEQAVSEVHDCGTPWAISRGPGRVVGAIARSITGVSVPLPDDFEFEYCPKCNQRNMTPELEARFLSVEDAARTKEKV